MFPLKEFQIVMSLKIWPEHGVYYLPCSYTKKYMTQGDIILQEQRS